MGQRTDTSPTYTSMQMSLDLPDSRIHHECWQHQSLQRLRATQRHHLGANFALFNHLFNHSGNLLSQFERFFRFWWLKVGDMTPWMSCNSMQQLDMHQWRVVRPLPRTWSFRWSTGKLKGQYTVTPLVSSLCFNIYICLLYIMICIIRSIYIYIVHHSFMSQSQRVWLAQKRSETVPCLVTQEHQPRWDGDEADWGVVLNLSGGGLCWNNDKKCEWNDIEKSWKIKY
jgi:hypothetical protein